MRKFLIKAVIVLSIAYLLVLATLFFLQRKFMYMPPNGHPGLAATSLTTMQEVELPVSDHISVPIWWHPPEEGEAVVLYFHGNGSSVYDGRFIYQHLIDQGFGILGAEYPGYPGASGQFSQAGLVDAALAQYDFVRSKGVGSEKIYLYGTSLGTGVAAQLSAHRDVSKIVMEAPFNSMLDMVKIRMRFFSFRPMIKDKYESDQALKDKSIPLLWLHGTHDRVIPISQGRKLYEGYSGPKQKHIIKGGTHNDIWISGGRETVTAFLKE